MGIHKKPKIIVIVGPTASGKTGLSLLLAKQFQGEVISADSRQVYKRLNIGTEKIDEGEMQGIPHHLLDVCDIDTIYTAMDFKKDAELALTGILARGNLPIIAGGTFFYIDTLLGKMSTAPVAPNPTLRKHLEAQDTEMLFSELERLDLERAQTIDKHNRRRLIRALEIISVLKKVPVQQSPKASLYDVFTIGILVDKDELRARLRARAQSALKKGLIEETKKLLDSGVSKERLSEIGHEYKVIMEYLDGNLTSEQLIQKLEEKNWQYAKRQLLWLKNDTSIVWIEKGNIEYVKELIDTFLKKKN